MFCGRRGRGAAERRRRRRLGSGLGAQPPRVERAQVGREGERGNRQRGFSVGAHGRWARVIAIDSGLHLHGAQDRWRGRIGWWRRIVFGLQSLGARARATVASEGRGCGIGATAARVRVCARAAHVFICRLGRDTAWHPRARLSVRRDGHAPHAGGAGRCRGTVLRTGEGGGARAEARRPEGSAPLVRSLPSFEM